MLRFDISRLRRLGRLAAGQSYGWLWSRDGEPFASIGIRTFHDAIELNYTRTPHEREPYDVLCRVELTRTPCNYGGHRTWFLCPDCGRTCAVLFGVSRRGNFACRVCQRLAYASESERPTDRCWRQQRKIEAKLTEEGDRPKGMRRRTFDRLCLKWEAIEERKDELFLPGLFRLAERLGMSPDELFG
jgi:hypothetical protein